ncbi:hypothetical protein BKA70DRAFT_95388 [Coprinopsis sp. MPI-PUGE-AT-0042]|nr:hypothetical protein BKA70DRAFT_95388 [Coprinopsis sp. MPI-PUGE-AT-0042]
MCCYQHLGQNWMVSLYHNGLNDIFADRIGPCKALRTASFLASYRTVLSSVLPSKHFPSSSKAHRIKIFSILSQITRTFLLRGRLLITSSSTVPTSLRLYVRG